MKNTINKFNNKFEESLISALILPYKTMYKNKSILELEKMLVEKENKISDLEDKLKNNNIIKSVKILNKGADIILMAAIPGGIPIVIVKKNIEPLKALYYQKLAIRELIVEKRKGGDKTTVKEQLQYLSENYNPVNYYKFKESITNQPANVVLENVEIISINENACGLFGNYTNLNTATMRTEELEYIHYNISKIEKTARHNSNVLPEHLNKITELKNDIQKSIHERICGMKSISHMYYEDLRASALAIPIEAKRLENCRLGTGECARKSVESISKYLRESYMSADKASELFSFILPLTNELVLTESVDGTDIMKTPQVLRKNLQNELSYNKKHLLAYKYILNESCEKLSNIDNQYTKNLNKLRCEVENLCEGLIKSKVIEIGNRFEIEYDDIAPELLRYKTLESLYEFSFNDSEDFSVMKEQLTNFVKNYNEYTIACEAVNMKKGNKNLLWKAGHAVEKKTRDILNNGKDAYDTSKRNVTPVKKSADNIEKLVNYPLNQLISIDKEERRKRIVEGRFRLRIWKLIRKGLLAGAISVVAGPIVAAIGFIGSFAVDKTLDKKIKHQIIHEMETELKLVEEKIEDAKGDRKNKEKYQLMRIKAKLEKEIDRIKFGLGSKY